MPSAEALALLVELREATNRHADRELERLEQRANLLRRINTRIDDFAVPVELEQTRVVLTSIKTFLE